VPITRRFNRAGRRSNLARRVSGFFLPNLPAPNAELRRSLIHPYELGACFDHSIPLPRSGKRAPAFLFCWKEGDEKPPSFFVFECYGNPWNGSRMERKKVILLVIVLMSALGLIIYMESNGLSISQLGSQLGRQLGRQSGSGRGNETQPDSPVGTRAKVAVNSLHLREGPGVEYTATYLLPQGWAVSYLGDSRPDNNGNIWVKVLVQTEQGPQDGWVNRNYLRPTIKR
jgi:Bacterial SH3 domain